MRSRLVLLALAVLLLAGCGAAGSGSGVSFSGQEKDVADVVGGIKSATQRKDGAKVCGELVTKALAARLAAGRSSCADQVAAALGDADGNELQVRDVTIAGTTAKAVVRQGDDGPTATYSLVRQGAGWRIDSFG